VTGAIEAGITRGGAQVDRDAVNASSTAEWIATYRAAEAALRGDRSIYRDRDAHLFVTDRRLRTLIGSPRVAQATLAFLDFWTPGLAGQAFVRYRYFDELLARMLADGLGQVVILGAGYDATGLRLAREGSSAKVFEVDASETQARKRELLDRIDPDVRTRTEFVECDFARNSVAERLREAGLATDEPALFSWLGVTWYLDAPTVESFLAELASVAAPGSRIVFDYMHAAALSGPSRPFGARLASRVVALQGEPWTFGRDPGEVTEWLAGLGWRIEENVRASQQRERYQRLHQGRLRAAAEWVSVVDAVRDDNASAGR
jgi:methyltransferase (TIGR00027 family)